MPFRPMCSIETLGPEFYDPVVPAEFPQHIIRYRNQHWANAIGLGDFDDAQWIDHFGRFQPLPGSLPQPLALRYHGHQFRQYNPDIGDGRGFLFAQMLGPDQRLMDLGTKGSGRTPHSRFGDGRLTLKGGVREVLATEMLAALGVNTSKTFSLIETGEALQRGDEPSPTRSAVLVRLSHSHIRYGTFQRLANLNDNTSMERLVDYVMINLADQPHHKTLTDKVSALMAFAVDGAATLAASYMAAGFVHGVLNTDNINITAESFDYGPYRFAPTYDPDFTAAYFDHGGLYAYGRQAEALHWNIYQLAKSLLILVDQAVLVPALETFPDHYEKAYAKAVHDRLGVQPELDHGLNMKRLDVIETALANSQCRLDKFYHDFYGGPLTLNSGTDNVYKSQIFDEVKAMLNKAEPTPTAMQNLKKPYFQCSKPCGLQIGEIESIWSAIESRDDWLLFEDKLHSIRLMAAAYQHNPIDL